jgi:alkanesulfonate monooxygenase SsuD/methylene tetrahydromethanopterin reductase-like flavin-dependent oxidoreductase (luciferase family)
MMMSSALQRPLKVGVLLPQVEGMFSGGVARWADILETAQTAEAVGFDSIWVVDHVLFPPRETEGPSVGCWEYGSLLGALAASTRRVELGTFVVNAGFRNPALLAKMVDCIEEISAGRLILGLGAGNGAFEHHAFGYPFDYRTSRFEEALTIIHTLLRTGQIDFAGHYHQARDCELRPRGPRPNGPPIIVGTSGERGMRATARYADGWNAPWARFQNRPDGVAPLRKAVDAACAAEGRDPSTLGRSLGVLVDLPGSPPMPTGQPAWNPGPGGRLLTGSPAELAETFRAFAREGIDHLQIWVNPTTPAGVEQLSAVLEHLDRP